MIRNMLNLRAKLLAACILGGALVGCGGGGGETPVVSVDPLPPANPSPTTFVDTASPQLVVPAPVYADSNKVAVFNQLNRYRLAAGLGAFAQNALLDTAAQSHSAYLSLNDTAGHGEISTNPGFTGASVQARVAAAGYAATQTTETASATTTAASGVELLDGLVAVPYHRMALLAYRHSEIGIGFSTEFPTNLVMNTAYASNNAQGAPTTKAVVWPIAGATGVKASACCEAPDPIPENNGADFGMPVSVQTHESKVLTTTSFTLTDATGGTVATKLLSYDTDSNLVSYQAKHVAFLIPRSPLQAATTYTATFRGAIDGVAYEKTWSFTTR